MCLLFFLLMTALSLVKKTGTIFQKSIDLTPAYFPLQDSCQICEKIPGGLRPMALMAGGPCGNNLASNLGSGRRSCPAFAKRKTQGQGPKRVRPKGSQTCNKSPKKHKQDMNFEEKPGKCKHALGRKSPKTSLAIECRSLELLFLDTKASAKPMSTARFQPKTLQNHTRHYYGKQQPSHIPM